jgi:hypothetical protein
MESTFVLDLKGAAETKSVMQKDVWSFPFAFQVPEDLPPSFTHKKGRIRITYELKAHIKIPKGRSVKEKVFLSVGSSLLWVWGHFQSVANSFQLLQIA